MQKITPCLWFDGDAEDAMSFYASVFPDFLHLTTTPGPENKPLVMTCRVQGQEFILLNGGPEFKFSEAVSFSVMCDTQDEVDDLWHKLSADGETSICGWLKDKFGLSWQIVPLVLTEMLRDRDSARAGRVMNAMLGMTKLDIAALQAAYEQ